MILIEEERSHNTSQNNTQQNDFSPEGEERKKEKLIESINRLFMCSKLLAEVSLQIILARL